MNKNNNRQMNVSACSQGDGDESVPWGVQNMMGLVLRLNHRRFYRTSRYAHCNAEAQANATQDYPTFPSHYYMVSSQRVGKMGSIEIPQTTANYRKPPPNLYKPPQTN